MVMNNRRSQTALRALALLWLATSPLPPLGAAEPPGALQPPAGKAVRKADEDESPVIPRAATPREPGVYPLTLSGRALSSDGMPIEGATIHIVSLNGID